MQAFDRALITMMFDNISNYSSISQLLSSIDWHWRNLSNKRENGNLLLHSPKWIQKRKSLKDFLSLPIVHRFTIRSQSFEAWVQIRAYSTVRCLAARRCLISLDGTGRNNRCRCLLPDVAVNKRGRFTETNNNGRPILEQARKQFRSNFFHVARYARAAARRSDSVTRIAGD